jgi:hypothetical protein
MLPVIGKYFLDLLMGLFDTNFVVTVLALPVEEDELTEHAVDTGMNTQKLFGTAQLCSFSLLT